MVRHLRNFALLLYAQRSSRHKNCRIGGLMFDSIILEVQLYTVSYKLQRKYFCSSTYSRKKDSTSRQPYIISHQNLETAAAWYGFISKASRMASILVFPFWRRRQRSYTLFYSVFGHDFLSPPTTIVVGIENYPSTSMSCCSDDLAQLLPYLDL